MLPFRLNIPASLLPVPAVLQVFPEISLEQAENTHNKNSLGDHEFLTLRIEPCSLREADAWPDASADLCAAGAERVALRLRLQNLGPSEEGRSTV